MQVSSTIFYGCRSMRLVTVIRYLEGIWYGILIGGIVSFLLIIVMKLHHFGTLFASLGVFCLNFLWIPLIFVMNLCANLWVSTFDKRDF
jgi:hypothetical protein